MSRRNPWSWIPTLYFAEGLPYVAVMTISVIMYKRLGISNTDIALYTGWLYLPWVIKPFWSPFVEMVKTKRWWTVAMQLVIAAGFAAIALTLPTSAFFRATLAAFWLVAFTSATHDIAADGFYMHGLSDHEQSFYVGIRSTFYRIATIAGQGLLVILAGLIEMSSGMEPVTLQVEATAKTIALSTPSESHEGQHFLFTPVAQTDTCLSVKDYMRAQNERNGFVTAEKASEQETDTKEGPFVHWVYGNFDRFTQWLRIHLGEAPRQVTTLQMRQQLVGITLSEQPQSDDPIILNMAFKKGDQSISMDAEATRFVFSKDNWNKHALMLVSVDPKLKGKTNATFEGLSGNIPFAWMVVFAVLSIFFFIAALYHQFVLPRPASDYPKKNVTVRNVALEFFVAFKTFFAKKHALAAILFILLYRLPEAQLVKLINPFLLDPTDRGGLGLTTGQVGIVYGTTGIIGLTIGGIIGGIMASRGGLKRWLWPMVCAITLPDLVYVYLSYAQPESLLAVNACVFVEQFGYGFGFTAYMLYLIYFSEGEHKTAHYAICTGFMALGMMLPGMIAGWLQETIGYRHFFLWAMLCCVVTFVVTSFIKVDPSFGKKRN